MKLTLQRTYRGSEYTIGRLYVDGVYFSNTLEDTDRGLKSSWTLEQIKAAKVDGETAIPRGTYQVTLKVQSPKFSAAKYSSQYGFCGGYLPRLLGVKGFDGILIHAGSYASHTDGCVLVGVNSSKGMLTNSTATFRNLYAKLEDADEKGEQITITIE